MFGPTSTCNLLAVLPKPPWTKPLNWNLHMTYNMEARIPFHLYVQPGAAQSSLLSYISTFAQFSTLPAEIQLRILSFCSAPTLFQIMRVSSMLRIEATKLFWASPNTYYLIESDWLLGGGYSGNSFHDLNFFAHVQNVEVDYLRESAEKIGPVEDFTATAGIKHNLIREFWKTLQKRFPRARRVVINKNWLYSLMEPIDAIPQSLQILLESCPPEIDVSAFIIEGIKSPIGDMTDAQDEYKYQRRLYRPTPTLDAENPLCWDRETILMPTKSFHGPVGEFKRLEYKSNMDFLQETALGPLAIEVLDRHHFDEGRLEPFSCPSPRCVIYFEKAGQWTTHAAETHSAAEFYFWWRNDIFPPVLKGVFERHWKDNKRKKRELFEGFKRAYDAWNEEGGDRRKEMENGWVDQLENDEAWYTGQKARESELFKTFTGLMEQDSNAVRTMEANFVR